MFENEYTMMKMYQEKNRELNKYFEQLRLLKEMKKTWKR